MARKPPAPGPDLMTPAEVSAMFRVNNKTVARWDKEGRFPPGTVVRTPGNIRRYHRKGVMQVKGEFR
jgi:DNA-binding transcriptional MerR regulator